MFRVYVVCFGAILSLVAQPAEATRWAILIGPDKYEEATKLRTLRFAGSDVRHLAETLIAAGHSPEHLVVMTTDADEEALRPTREAVFRQIRTVISRMADSTAESLTVVFAGHGVTIGGRSFLCPSDARLGEPDRTLLSLSDLSQLMAASQAAQKFLVIDACREEIDAPGSSEFNLLTGLQSMNLNGEGSQGLVYFASCLARQRSIEDEELQHGVFMYYFTEAIAGLADVQSAGNRDGMVSCHEAFQYASDKTRHRSRAQTGWEQQPWYEGRATSGLTLATLTEKQRMQLQSIVPDEPTQLSGSVLHSQLELTEALYALQDGNMDTVLIKSLEAIKLDPSNRMAYRTAAMAHQFQGQYEKAIAQLAMIDEPLRVRVTSGTLEVKAAYETVGTAQNGDVVEVKEITESSDGTKWGRVRTIRRKDAESADESLAVNGHVRLDQLQQKAPSSAQLVADFGRQNQQPVALTQSWQSGSGSGRAASALERYDRVREVINRVPYGPGVPDIPYRGVIGGRFGF